MALIIRCQIAVFSAYRTDQFADPDGFKTQLGAVLEQYPDEVITYVCDPRTGIQRRSKWPPTISEMVEACDDRREFLVKQRAPRRPAMERPPTPLLRDMPAGHLGKVFVPASHQKYGGLVDWAAAAEPVYWRYGKSSDGRNGIWVPFGIWEKTPARIAQTE